VSAIYQTSFARLFATQFSIQLSRHLKWHNSTSASLCGTIPQQITLAPAKRGNGMPFDLLGGRRNRILISSGATILALIIFISTVSCSGPRADLPLPIAEIVELFSGTESTKQQLVQQNEAQSKVRRVQPKASTSKAPTENAPKAASQSVARPAAKKANTSPASDAQSEQQLFQEFLEWRKRQKGQP
jgi:cell division septation protein DedD